MKTSVLDLNAYGVNEMSSAEMRKIEGGIWIPIIIIMLCYLTGACVPGNGDGGGSSSSEEWDCVRRRR